MRRWDLPTYRQVQTRLRAAENSSAQDDLSPDPGAPLALAGDEISAAQIKAPDKSIHRMSAPNAVT